MHGLQFGTLGEARGMLTLLQRFDYTLLPPQDGKRIGIHLSASQWLDNYWPSFQLRYNAAKNQTAFIEVRASNFWGAPTVDCDHIQDYYEPYTSASTKENIIWKYNVTTAHIVEATKSSPDQLYITFASAEHDFATPPVNPHVRS